MAVIANLLLMMPLSAALGPQGTNEVNLSCGAWPTGLSTNVQDMKPIPLAPERWCSKCRVSDEQNGKR